MAIDLFGNDTPLPGRVKGLSKYKKFKKSKRYRKAQESHVRCKYCTSLQRWIHPTDKHYYKCSQMGGSWSEASDIRLSYVCDLFVSITIPLFKTKKFYGKSPRNAKVIRKDANRSGSGDFADFTKALKKLPDVGSNDKCGDPGMVVGDGS